MKSTDKIKELCMTVNELESKLDSQKRENEAELLKLINEEAVQSMNLFAQNIRFCRRYELRSRITMSTRLQLWRPRSKLWKRRVFRIVHRNQRTKQDQIFHCYLGESKQCQRKLVHRILHRLVKWIHHWWRKILRLGRSLLLLQPSSAQTTR